MALIQVDVKQWQDQIWRLHNLYWCVDHHGKVFKFKPNETQARFLKDYWFFNVILKGRQMGFTTLIDLLALDQCIFVPNFSAGIIAHNLEAAGRIFRDKIQFPWQRLPEGIARANPLLKDTQSELVWANGSALGVSVSMRSGTINFLHVSEYGKISRLYPRKAREIRLGSFPAVHAGNFIFVESTAEGEGGDYYDLVKDAIDLRDAKEKLTPLDFKMHFYPWWKHKSYTMDPRGVKIPAHFERYFAELAKQKLATGERIRLTEGQKAWYVKEARRLKVDTKEKHADMKQEYPSFEDEAFEAANDEKYFGARIAELKRSGHILPFPVLKKRVNQFWDIGLDKIAIWFHQYAAQQHRFVDYYETEAKTIEEALLEIQDKPYLRGTIYLPHDAEDQSVVTKVSAADVVRATLPNVPVIVVPRVERKITSINAARNALAEAWFLEGPTDEGVEHLKLYRKQWDEDRGVWKDDPVHDQHSHGADAWQQFAIGWKPEHEYLGVPLPPMNSTIGDKRAGY